MAKRRQKVEKRKKKLAKKKRQQERSIERKVISEKARVDRAAAEALKGPSTFVMAPFAKESKIELEQKKANWEFLKKKGWEMRREGTLEVLRKIGNAEKRSYGWVIDMDISKSKTFLGPQVQEIVYFVNMLYTVQDPTTTRRAHAEIIRLVRQLKKLGFNVNVQGTREKKRAPFVKLAEKAGAKKVGVYSSGTVDIPGLTGTTWARDQWVKIGGIKERPKASLKDLKEMARTGQEHYFGEGGAFVQVGPKEYLISDYIARDPRVKEYQRKGFKFFPVHTGLFFDRVVSEILGTRVYLDAPHIDFSFGGVPAAKIVAVDPIYQSDHAAKIQELQKTLGVKVVTVPKGESDRHPQNFLPLGENRVLVDSGAPKFVERLRKAGAEVIPTATPLNALLDLKGGLHCLFNEL